MLKKIYQYLQESLYALERAATYQSINKHSKSTIIEKSISPNNQNPEYTNIEAWRNSSRKFVLFIIYTLLTGGIVLGLCLIFPKLYLMLSMESCSFKDATLVSLTGPDGKLERAQIKSCIFNNTNVRYFVYRKQRYVYNVQYSAFKRTCPSLPESFAEIHDLRHGISKASAKEFIALYGYNEIEIDVIPIGRMLRTKLLQPFYLFQIASVIIWIIQSYTTYALAILFMSLASVVWEVYSAKKNEAQLQALTKLDCILPVFRDGELLMLDYKQVVVGDAIILSASDFSYFNGRQCPCDMVLVQGECIMDESSLTGESVPVTKLPLQFSQGDAKNFREKYKKNVLFSGSKFQRIVPKKNWLITNQEEESMAIAIVLATGFETAKGQLFRSIMYPSQIVFKFDRDSYKFLWILGFVAIIAFLNRAISSIRDGVGVFMALITSLDLITIAVPPALPLVLTVGIGISIQRLKKKYIYCIDPQKVNYAGQIDVMGWDKTGTLTVPQLNFFGVDKPNALGNFSDILNFSPEFVYSNSESIERIMLTCHQVSQDNGILLGHSVDIEMFQNTGWKLSSEYKEYIQLDKGNLPVVGAIQPMTENLSKNQIFIFKQFEFDAQLQCSSVIASTLEEASSNNISVYVKGSPEAVIHLCNADSIPSNFSTVLQRYAINGYYVIACAYKKFDNSLFSEFTDLKRKRVEFGLEFAGFILFQNPLKENAPETIETLKKASIRSVMITGDHALNAIHVCKQLNLCRNAVLVDLVGDQLRYSQVLLDELNEDEKREQVSIDIYDQTSTLENRPIDDLVNTLSLMPNQTEIAITGKALDALIDLRDYDYIEWMIGRARIFARTKPDQKTWIIDRLIKQGKYVAMCGDGTNDCGALKQAHVGLALSDAEASIIAPFTSAKKSITDIVLLIREGRCALETSFLSFKYMMLYPIIQLLMAAYLNQLGTALSNNQFLFDDLAIVTMLALFLIDTRPAFSLSATKPTDDLFHPTVVSSIVGQCCFSVLFFFTNYLITISQPWFCSIKDATMGLDSNYMPSQNKTFPCYPIDIGLDYQNPYVIKSFENTSIWQFTHFQLVIVPLAISFVSHFRLPFWTNRKFLYYFLFIFSLCTYLLLTPNNSNAKEPGPGEYTTWVDNIFKNQQGIPFTFRLAQFGLVLMYSVLVICWEIYIVNGYVRRWTDASSKGIDDWQRDRTVGIGLANAIELEQLISSKSAIPK